MVNCLEFRVCPSGSLMVGTQGATDAVPTLAFYLKRGGLAAHEPPHYIDAD